MHHILIAIKEIIDSNLKLYLPHVASDHLENNGAVYYMNGKDGTEFDWYINEKFPPFMVFYNDKANLGAVKLLLYKDGGIVIYLFDDCGKKLVKEVHTELKATETELFTLAVLLKDQADDKKLWNADLTSINTDIQLHNDKCNQFRRNQKNYAALKNKFMILNSRSYVSKKITKEGWKVGYMERSEPMDETDSGWAFFAGDEGEDYVSDAGNFDVISVGAVCQQLDSDIFKYIDMPAGTRLIRISPDAFEADKNDKEIYMMKSSR